MKENNLLAASNKNIKLLITNDKHALLSKPNLWRTMLNFDQHPRGNGISFSIGVIYGWIYYLVRLLDIRSLSWEFIIKLGEGIISAIVLGFVVKVFNSFYEERMKDRITNFFKLKSHEKKKDNERAA